MARKQKCDYTQVSSNGFREGHSTFETLFELNLAQFKSNVMFGFTKQFTMQFLQ